MDFVGHRVARSSHGMNVVSLFPRDMASQKYPSILRRNDYGESERKLMLAVLEDAIYCFQSYGLAQDRIRRRLFLQAKEWLMEDDDAPWQFSFANICAVFGLSLQYIRAGLMRHKDIAKESNGRVNQFAVGREKTKRLCRGRSFSARGNSPRSSTLVRVIP